MNYWKKLNNPPVVVALFQLKFNSIEIKLNDFLNYDKEIKKILPNRNDNYQVGIDLGNSTIPLGVSKISGTSETRIESYIYFSNDQKIKLELSQNTITFIDENKYLGWENFKNNSIKVISILSNILNKVEIIRTSIRFINRFSFKEFNTPEDFFNTLISSTEKTELPYPLRQYSFKLYMDIPDSDIYSIVNQNIENIRKDLYIYTFDIDVLDKQHIIFNIETINQILETLREVKNTIFFNNITSKTENLCN